ncbi:MAG: shikimate dehydrogenase [Anaerolineae bacterium]|nr:shikimate dehydrogenase [Anaerolineae bacterium]NUQ03200.1 shikimate dehydrogenase [Anaerolineae bacterium]
MSTDYKYELVGCFGDPVRENPTGIMQEAAFVQAGLPWRYELLEVTSDALPDAVRGAKALGFKGFNCTIPHKVAVLPLLDAVAADAALIGAVNTVRREGNRWIGENTDGKGFMRGLREILDPKGRRVVVLGAGGAARAITVELALAGAGPITVVNRSGWRGEELARHLNEKAGATAGFHLWSNTVGIGSDVDILINATSIGLYPDVDAMPDVALDGARGDLLVCDVIPNPPVTPLIRAAQARGMKTITGLPMLVYQGAIGYEMWTGGSAPIDAMKKALEAAFGVSA